MEQHTFPLFGQIFHVAAADICAVRGPLQCIVSLLLMKVMQIFTISQCKANSCSLQSVYTTAMSFPLASKESGASGSRRSPMVSAWEWWPWATWPPTPIPQWQSWPLFLQRRLCLPSSWRGYSLEQRLQWPRKETVYIFVLNECVQIIVAWLQAFLCLLVILGVSLVTHPEKIVAAVLPNVRMTLV